MSAEPKKAYEGSIGKINRIVASEIAAFGNDRLSVGALESAFAAAIRAETERLGTAGQLLLLADRPDFVVGRPSAGDNATDVVSSCVERGLLDALDGKLADLSFKILENKVVSTIRDASRVALRVANLERGSAGLADDVVTTGCLPPDFAEKVDELRSAVLQCARRRSDKEFMTSLGIRPEALVKLADRLSGLSRLHGRDRARLETMAAREVSPETSMALAA
jgi:hypothetical protein